MYGCSRSGEINLGRRRIWRVSEDDPHRNAIICTFIKVLELHYSYLYILCSAEYLCDECDLILPSPGYMSPDLGNRQS